MLSCDCPYLIKPFPTPPFTFAPKGHQAGVSRDFVPSRGPATVFSLFIAVVLRQALLCLGLVFLARLVLRIFSPVRDFPNLLDFSISRFFDTGGRSPLPPPA